MPLMVAIPLLNKTILGQITARRFAVFAALLALSSCSSLQIERIRSDNQSSRIKFLVMHYTASDYETSLTTLVKGGTGVSSHYLIPELADQSYADQDIKVLQLVDESSRAWHAGSSYWQGREEINDHSIGIEIVNVPKCHRALGQEALARNQDKSHDQICFYPDYDANQIEALVELTKDILARNPDIGPTQIIGHSDIAPLRKNDPGPRFPWQQLYRAGIGAWYEKEDVTHYWELFLAQQAPNIGVIQRALKSYGYQIIETGINDLQTQAVIKAFQAHFIPWQVSGKADEQTVSTLFALLEKYFPQRAKQLLARYEKERISELASVNELPKGQIEQRFPQLSPSKSVFSNDRTSFKSYQGKGELIIDNIDASSADIYINGKLLSIKENMQANTQYAYSLAKHTVSGINTLKVENVLPQGSAINIRIPFPQLEDATKKYRAKFAEVDQLIEQDIRQGFPGAVLVVVKDGKIIKRSAYGFARKFADGGLELTEPEVMTSDHLFDLASNTKMFATNLALMKLNSEGRLDFNKTLNDYLPEYQGEGRDSIQVHDLLTHRAGYAPEVKFFQKDNHLGERFFSQSANKTKQLLLTKVPLATGKQVKQVYSDTDYMLLGLLVERITGMPLDVYLENEFFKPLGLQNTLFNPLAKGRLKKQFAATEIQGNSRGGRLAFDNIRSHVLQGEVHDEKAFYSLAGVAGHAGLFSTADDIALLAQVLLNRGGYGQQSVFSSPVLDQFIKPSDTNGSYGLGWRRADNGERKWHFGPYASPQAYGHTGWTGTVTVIDPSHDLAIVLLTNARHSVIEGDEDDYQFSGKQYQTGMYGSVISLIYETVLDKLN